jgi:predicted nucleic acid-binding protein
VTPSSQSDPEVIQSSPDVLRVVIDANITLAMFLARRDRPLVASSKRVLLSLLPSTNFRWLWSPDIIADYERGALAIENDARIQRNAVFDRIGFRLFLAALRLPPPVEVSATTLRTARRRIDQATRERDRDLDDAIYLACAVDGEAQLLTSQDSDLLSLGSIYEGVQVMNWQAFTAELRSRQLL